VRRVDYLKDYIVICTDWEKTVGACLPMWVITGRDKAQLTLAFNNGSSKEKAIDNVWKFVKPLLDRSVVVVWEDGEEKEIKFTSVAPMLRIPENLMGSWEWAREGEK